MADSRTLIYEDQENRVPGVGLKNKREVLRPLGNNGQNVPRTALGVLSTAQSCNVRVQPSRTAKQGVNYDAGFPTKFSQDENAYARPKAFSTSNSSSSSLSLGLSIYNDPPKTTSENTNSSTEHSLLQSSLLSTTNASRTNCSASSSGGASSLTDRSTLQYAASKLEEQIAFPDCLAALPRTGPVVSSSCDMMELSVTDEDSTDMSVVTPGRPQEDLLRLREEQLYDMTEYAADIYAYLREAEKIHRPRSNYMDKQTDITVSMRWILVDWMVEVAEEYNLSTETLYLAVSYIDRFLSHMSVKRDKLQLVGTTAMFIASKYEEIYPPDVSQFAYITDNTYKVSHILRMEHLILKVLSFDMAVPTAYTFVNKFARTLGCTEATTSLALFIAELSMLDCNPFLRFLPSEIAASSLAIANFTQGHTPWPSVMTDNYHYTLDDLKECYVNLNRSFGKANETAQHSIREKYKTQKMHAASTVKPRSELPF